MPAATTTTCSTTAARNRTTSAAAGSSIWCWGNSDRSRFFRSRQPEPVTRARRLPLILTRCTTVEFAGEFETHVTVSAADGSALDALRAWAESHGLTFHHIVLERGRTPSQPMV